MNFLAHLLLSGDDPELRLGNVLADFVKGRARESLAPGVRRGLACHRVIDAFTDTHPLVAASKARLSPTHRRFAGVLIDVYFDHLLARSWERYDDRPLPEFTRGVYRDFRAQEGLIPPLAREALARMAEQDWLGSYATVGGVEVALARISIRLDRPGLLTPSLRDLLTQTESIEADFLAFFPELRRRVNDWLAGEPAPTPPR